MTVCAVRASPNSHSPLLPITLPDLRIRELAVEIPKKHLVFITFRGQADKPVTPYITAISLFPVDSPREFPDQFFVHFPLMHSSGHYK